MLLVAWLLIVQVYGVIADSVDLTEDKTYWFIIPEQGFSIKICGTGSGKPELCYDSVKRNRVRGECSNSTSCVIRPRYLEDKDKKELQIDYGGGFGRVESECAVVKIEEKIQYGLNADPGKNGTCQWKTDEKRMLAVDVTTAVGFTMTILDVRQVPGANESPLPFWVYIVSGVGALAVLAGFAVGGFFLYRFIKKPKNDGQTVKEGEKNDPKALATEKNPRLQEEAANFVGQSRERGTKEKVETKKDELSDGKETLKKTSDEPMKDKPAGKDEKKKEFVPKCHRGRKLYDSDCSYIDTDHPEAIDGTWVPEGERKIWKNLKKKWKKFRNKKESDDRAKPRKREVDGSTDDEKPKRKREKPKKVADSDESSRYETDHQKALDERERKKKLRKKKVSRVDTDHPKAIEGPRRRIKKERKRDSKDDHGSVGPPKMEEKKKDGSSVSNAPVAAKVEEEKKVDENEGHEKTAKMKKEMKRVSNDESGNDGPPEVTEKKNEPVQTTPCAKVEQAKKAEEVEKAEKNGKQEKSSKKKEEKRGSDQPVKSDNVKVEQKKQSRERKDGESADEKTEANQIEKDRQMAVDETQKSCTKKKLKRLRKMAPKPERQEKLKSQKEAAKGTILEFPENQDYIKSTVYRKGTEDYDEGEIYRVVHHQGTWWLKNGYLTQKELDFMSERYLFQNRRYAHIIEWKMLVAHADDGAVLAKKMTVLADEYLEGVGLPDEGYLFSGTNIDGVKHAKTPGYIWARCFIKENPELMNVKVADVLDKWTINGLAILLFANITLNERAAILRTIKLKTCHLINQFGKQVWDMSFYPLPLLYRVYEIYNDKSKVFPSEYPEMPFMQNPAIILEPPKRDFEINPPKVRREYGPKEQKDASEDIYDQARMMNRVLEEREKMVFKELTVSEDSDMSSEEYEKKLKTEKRRSVVARIAKFKRERNEVNEFQGEDKVLAKILTNNGPKRKIPRKFRTDAEKKKEESKAEELPSNDEFESSIQKELNAKVPKDKKDEK